MITTKQINDKWVCEGYSVVQIGNRSQDKKIVAYGNDPFEAFDNYAIAYKAYLKSLGLKPCASPTY